MNIQGNPEVGIYKRIQESKKKRKKPRTRLRKWSRKKESFFFFLGRFLGRVLVFLFSYFLVFFINSNLWSNMDKSNCRGHLVNKVTPWSYCPKFPFALFEYDRKYINRIQEELIRKLCFLYSSCVVACYLGDPESPFVVPSAFTCHNLQQSRHRQWFTNFEVPSWPVTV